MIGLVVLIVLVVVQATFLTLVIGGNAHLSAENRHLRAKLAGRRDTAPQGLTLFTGGDSPASGGAA